MSGWARTADARSAAHRSFLYSFQHRRPSTRALSTLSPCSKHEPTFEPYRNTHLEKNGPSYPPMHQTSKPSILAPLTRTTNESSIPSELPDDSRATAWLLHASACVSPVLFPSIHPSVVVSLCLVRLRPCECVNMFSNVCLHLSRHSRACLAFCACVVLL